MQSRFDEKKRNRDQSYKLREQRDPDRKYNDSADRDGNKKHNLFMVTAVFQLPIRPHLGQYMKPEIKKI